MICVNSVSVYPSSITLKVGNWYYNAYAEVCPPNADCKEVQWHSDNPSIASVNASSGYIRANAVGITKIYATATDGSDCSDYLTVTVKNSVPVTSVTLNRSSLSLEEGQCASLSATVYPSNATNKNVTWTSSNKKVATVSGGIVTAISAGSAKITATAADGSGKSASCTVYVTGDVLVSSITVSPSNITLSVGGSTFLTANVCPTNATNKCVTWSTDNPCVATVNPNSGLVTAQGAGTATIYATAQDGSGVYGTCNISVSYVPVKSVILSQNQKTLSVDEKTTLRATVCPSCASNKSVIWTSSDTSVATVGTYTGVVTAKSGGTATITARSVDGGKADTCTIWCDEYLYELVHQFGFSESVALLIRSLYDRVDNIFTNETELQKAWRCARLLSEFSYDDFKFNDVAGSLTNQENRKSYFMNTLGYTEDEYNTLIIALPDNHDDGDTIDFTHMQYSLAARLAYTLDKDGWASNLGSQFKTGNWGIYSDEDISYLGGWLGDATLRNDGGTGVPILKNDDYMSDLDAENVYRLLLQGYASIDALNVYYSSMNSSNTRADIFLQYIPYSTVKQKIFYELIDAQLYMFLSNASSQGDIFMTQYWLNLINNEQYHFDEIKSKYSDTYDFLMSLNDRLLTLAHYQ